MATYPAAQGSREGCKVGWLFFENKETAYEAAEIAKQEAIRKGDLGYDFGYQVPGSVSVMRAGQYEGMFEVCIP